MLPVVSRRTALGFGAAFGLGALGGVRLADLVQREIVVYRSGAVVLDAVRFVPEETPGPGFELKASPRVTRTTTTGGLVRPTPDLAVPPTGAAPRSISSRVK